MSACGDNAWLGRYEARSPIRTSGGFHLYTALSREATRRHVVAVGAPGADVAAVRRAFARVVEAHSRLSHRLIAPVAASGEHEGQPFVAFDCPATLDLETLLRLGRSVRAKFAHAHADGFIRDLRVALQAAHRSIDPVTKRATCIGSLACGNVLFAANGEHWLVGFGHNIVTRDAWGSHAGESVIFQAPEVAVGSPAVPTSDFVALVLFMRSMLGFVELELGVVRTLAGNTVREDFELARKIVWFERAVVAAPVERRATITEAVRVSDRIRELLGVVPDPAGFRTDVAAVLTRAGWTTPSGYGAVIDLGPEGRTFTDPAGEHHVVGDRPAVRRILLALVDMRSTSAGRALSVRELFEAGWPGERAVSDSMSNRVYVTISFLRRHGLRSAIQRHDGGYRIDPDVEVRVRDA